MCAYDICLVADINECDGDNGCNQICENHNGSYSCTCEHGFVLLSDNMTCEGIINKPSMLSFSYFAMLQILMSVRMIMVGVYSNALTLLDLITVPVMMVLS